MKQAIAFDLDGTLLDVSIRDYQIYKDLIDKLGGHPLSYEAYWPMRQAKTDIHRILDDSGIHKDNDVSYFLANRKVLMEDERYLRLDSLFPNVKDVLACLSNDFDVYVLTIRHNQQNTHAQLKALGIDQYHTIIVEGNKEQQMKLIPNLRFMVGDTENDILPANKLGITSIAVTTGIRHLTLLRELKSKFIVNKLEEILNLLYSSEGSLYNF